jgi:hypothetical protein
VLETAAGNALTNRLGLRDPATLTDVRGPCGPLAAVIAELSPRTFCIFRRELPSLGG